VVSRTTADVPSEIAAVDAEWLTAVLRADATIGETACVTEVRAEQIAQDSGFSSLLYRLHITGNGGAPSTLIAKLPAQSEARQAMEVMDGYARELAFYQHVAARAPMGTPHVYAARMARDSTDFVLLLEDLRDWDNADQLAGLSLDRTRLGMTQLAGLHAWSTEPTNSDVLQAFPSVGTPMMRDIIPVAFTEGWRVYREKTEAPVPAAVACYAERFAEYAPTALKALCERSMLVHGDIRADNMFFYGDQLKVVDFQFAARGAGASDIGYLVSQGLPTAVRSGRDEELLREYLGLLSERGVRDYPFDDAWRHYRCAVAYFMALPALPLISWESLPDRSLELCMRLVERAVTTIDEIDALEVFK
jgi:aminoglycoside/choline kinase family phosphotransferase